MRRTCSVIMALTLAACSGNAAPDAGSNIEVPDGAIPPDAGHDAGADATDAGPLAAPDAGPTICGTVDYDSRTFPPLPDTCQPRCSAETFAALQACTDQACAVAALNADTTPTAYVDSPYGPLGVSCAGSAREYNCLGWQNYSCDVEFCLDEYLAFVYCPTTPNCPDEAAALDACRNGSVDWLTCSRTRGRECFP